MPRVGAEGPCRGVSGCGRTVAQRGECGSGGGLFAAPQKSLAPAVTAMMLNFSYEYVNTSRTQSLS